LHGRAPGLCLAATFGPPPLSSPPRPPGCGPSAPWSTADAAATMFVAAAAVFVLRSLACSNASSASGGGGSSAGAGGDPDRAATHTQIEQLQQRACATLGAMTHGNKKLQTRAGNAGVVEAGAYTRPRFGLT